MKKNTTKAKGQATETWKNERSRSLLSYNFQNSFSSDYIRDIIRLDAERIATAFKRCAAVFERSFLEPSRNDEAQALEPYSPGVRHILK